MTQKPDFPPLRPAEPDPGTGRLDEALPQAEGDDRPLEGPLACIAAFYPRESAMREAARTLCKHHGLKPSQLVLMGPDDAEPARFARHRLRWAGRWSGGQADPLGLPMFLVGLVGVLLLAMAIGWWVLYSDEPLFWMLVGLVFLTLPIALLSSRLAGLWSNPPRARRFESSVRQQLSQGAWALVAHRMPLDNQAGAVALLRSASLRWCAVAGPPRRL